jgi:uncharacterized coiled-coil protein SlyX
MEAVEDLQMRLTYQEDEIKHLNRAVALQQAEIDALRREVARLSDMLRALAAGSAEDHGQEIPPHY